MILDALKLFSNHPWGEWILNMDDQGRILGEHSVAGNQTHGLGHGLGHQHMIKRIIVVHGQCRQYFRVQPK